MSKLILHLYHGRQDPDERMDDWGEPGPYFEINFFHCTYFSSFWIQFEGQHYATDMADEMIYDGLIYYDGMYYGDWEIYQLNEREATIQKEIEIKRFDPKKTLKSKFDV